MQAEDGVGLPEEILEGTSFEKAAQLYFMFTRFDFLWSLNYLALVLINFFEVCTVTLLSIPVSVLCYFPACYIDSILLTCSLNLELVIIVSLISCSFCSETIVVLQAFS